MRNIKLIIEYDGTGFNGWQMQRLEARGFPRLRSGQARLKVNVHTQGGVLKVEFTKSGSKVKNVCLDGAAKAVFTGEVDHV